MYFYFLYTYHFRYSLFLCMIWIPFAIITLQTEEILYFDSADLPVINSLSMYLIVALFYVQLQRIFYCTYNSRFMKFFSFNTLETWPHCLLDYFVFNKKTCVQFTFDLWKVISRALSLCFFCVLLRFSLCVWFS